MLSLSNNIQNNYCNQTTTDLPVRDYFPDPLFAHTCADDGSISSETEAVNEKEILIAKTHHLRGRAKKKHSKWSSKEDQMLLFYVNQDRLDFPQISEYMQGRSSDACRSRYYQLLLEEKINDAIDAARIYSESEIKKIKNIPFSQEERKKFSLMKAGGAKLPEISLYFLRSPDLCKKELSRLRQERNQINPGGLPRQPYNFFYPSTRAMVNTARAYSFNADFFRPGEGLESEKLFQMQDPDCFLQDPDCFL